jgi:hypothetical protein
MDGHTVVVAETSTLNGCFVVCDCGWVSDAHEHLGRAYREHSEHLDEIGRPGHRLACVDPDGKIECVCGLADAAQQAAEMGLA